MASEMMSSMTRGNLIYVERLSDIYSHDLGNRGTHAVPGRGLEGDRYYLGTGHFSGNGGPSYEVTLIEVEAIYA